MLKKIDKMILKGFIGPYLLSFFVAQFVLVMQFLWKYIDDILGKGFGMFDVLELVFYFATSNIPMALPIAILLSSVMIFGNMSERFELSSMKSAGISLLRIMRPAIGLSIFTALLSLFASNYLKPAANYQFKKRMRLMKTQKSSLAIEEKIFNKDFDGYRIRVGHKSKKTDSIADILIYDHMAGDKSLLNLVSAKRGRMYNSPDGQYFMMELYDGTAYREMKREVIHPPKDKIKIRTKDKKADKKSTPRKKYPFMRTTFKEWTKAFDLSQFKADQNNIYANKKAEDMLNGFQLARGIDTIDAQVERLYQSTINYEETRRKREREIYRKRQKYKSKIKRKINKRNVHIAKKTKGQNAKKKVKMPKKTKKNVNKGIVQKDLTDLSNYKSWVETLSPDDPNMLDLKAVQNSNKLIGVLRNAQSKMTSYKRKKGRYQLRLHQQFSFALVCIVFLFIGAPLGSIIRKGGYGYPLLYSILFYMVFILTTIMGEKLFKSQKLGPLLAAWLPVLILILPAFILTYKALRDERLTIFR